ncbi:MAG: phosphate-starvation-inducible PsiE family protein [Actinomycetota bacterium]
MATTKKATTKKKARRNTADLFRYIEQFFYVIVALALAVAGAILFVLVVYRFVKDLSAGDSLPSILKFLDGLLLVFITAELIHTVQAVIKENVLRTEPFLIVGIVAAIRRVIVITAEAGSEAGKPKFDDLMMEMSILMGSVLILGLTIFLVRQTARTEPTPAHETSEVEEGSAD